jgi:hypothetical protein
MNLKDRRDTIKLPPDHVMMAGSDAGSERQGMIGGPRAVGVTSPWKRKQAARQRSGGRDAAVPLFALAPVLQ